MDQDTNWPLRFPLFQEDAQANALGNTDNTRESEPLLHDRIPKGLPPPFYGHPLSHTLSQMESARAPTTASTSGDDHTPPHVNTTSHGQFAETWAGLSNLSYLDQLRARAERASLFDTGTYMYTQPFPYGERTYSNRRPSSEGNLNVQVIPGVLRSDLDCTRTLISAHNDRPEGDRDVESQLPSSSSTSTSRLIYSQIQRVFKGDTVYYFVFALVCTVFALPYIALYLFFRHF